MRDDISARCTAIEECYEFMLAYAGQGLAGDEGSQSTARQRQGLRAYRSTSGGSSPVLLECGLLLARNPARDKICGSGVVKAPPSIDTSSVIGLRPHHRFVYLVYTLAVHRLQGSQRTAAAGWEVLHDHKCRGHRLTRPGFGADSRDLSSMVSRQPGFARRMTVARDSSDERALHLAIENPGLWPGGL